jgi:hypothetical protein
VHAPHPPSPQPSFVPDKPMPEISFRSDVEAHVDRAEGALLVGVRGDLPRVASASWPRRRFFAAPDEGTRGAPGGSSASGSSAPRGRRDDDRRAFRRGRANAARALGGGARGGGRGGDEISRTRHVRHVVAGAIVGRWGQFAPRRTSKEREQGRVALALGQDVALAVDIRDRGGVLALHRLLWARGEVARRARCARGEGEKKKDVEQRRGRDLSETPPRPWTRRFADPPLSPALTRHAGVLEPPRKSWHLLLLGQRFLNGAPSAHSTPRGGDDDGRRWRPGALRVVSDRVRAPRARRGGAHARPPARAGRVRLGTALPAAAHGRELGRGGGGARTTRARAPPSSRGPAALRPARSPANHRGGWLRPEPRGATRRRARARARRGRGLGGRGRAPRLGGGRCGPVRVGTVRGPGAALGRARSTTRSSTRTPAGPTRTRPTTRWSSWATTSCALRSIRAIPRRKTRIVSRLPPPRPRRATRRSARPSRASAGPSTPASSSPSARRS